MDMEGALRARIIDAGTLAGDAVAWLEQPQGQALPHVTLAIVSEQREQHMKGFQDLRFTRVQADTRAATYAEAKALAEQVIAAAVPGGDFHGTNFRRASVDGPRDLGERIEGEAFTYRKSLDLLVRHSPA